MQSHGTTTRQAGGHVKTTAIRLEPELHAQLSALATLKHVPMSHAIQEALEAYVQEQRKHPEVAARAKELLDNIEQEAATRRGAIAALLDEAKVATPDGGTGKRPGRQRRQAGEGSATS